MWSIGTKSHEVDVTDLAEEKKDGTDLNAAFRDKLITPEKKREEKKSER